MIKKINKNIFALVFVGLFLVYGNFSQAEGSFLFNIFLDKDTISKGYTVSAFSDAIKLSLVPGILASSTAVEILDISSEPITKPWQLDMVSGIYQFEFKNKQAYDNHKPFYIQLTYPDNNNYYKQVYFFDKTHQSWRPLPTVDFPKEKFVRSLIHLPYARIAIFSNSQIVTAGKASWYAYKGGDFAAYPDFPKGSRLRVKNQDNGKFVDVTVNDWGPDRKLHPDRAIDLDKKAFAKIANLSEGVVNVEINPLYIAPENGKVLSAEDEKIAESVVKVTAKSAIAMNEKNGKIIFDKNSTETLPLASLTKLVFAKVFLDTKVSFDNISTYDLQDEKYNFQYVDHEWEVAKLKVNDGDKMTIEDLFYSALVGSANNAVESLVRESGLRRSDFIEEMNKIVKKWGADSTFFEEPTGLSPKNMSSAKDYAIITREVLKNPIIQKASIMPVYEFDTINTKEHHKIKNTNKIITKNKYDINGSKTGYLHEAGYCLMSRVKAKNGDNIIVVTLGADDRGISFLETEKLINYSLKNINI